MAKSLLSLVRQEGKDDHQLGRPLHLNPYANKSTVLQYAWRSGWIASYQDEKEKAKRNDKTKAHHTGIK